MAAAFIDQHAVERLIGETFSAVSHASLTDKLLPHEEIPDDPTGCVAQFLGCDFEFQERQAVDGEADVAAVQFEIALLCPGELSTADAYQIQSVASAIRIGMVNKSASGTGHRVDIIDCMPTRVDTATPGFRAMLLTFTAEVSRTGSQSLE